MSTTMRRTKRLLAVLLIACCAPAMAGKPAPSASAGDGRIGALAWMSGRWMMKQGDQEIEELWAGPLGGTLTGVFRWSRAGKVTLYELITIEEDNDGRLVLRLRHFNRGLVPWKSETEKPMTYILKQVDRRKALFEDQRGAESGQIEYERDGDTLHVRVRSDHVLKFEFTLAD